MWYNVSRHYTGSERSGCASRSAQQCHAQCTRHLQTIKQGYIMKVECKISADCKEPYAALYIEKMTPVIAEAISLLEKAETGSAALAAVREGNTYFIERERLELVCTEGREVVCYDGLKNRYVLSKPLYELEQVLGSRFVRISKSTIINIRRIDHVAAGFNGTMELVMKNGMESYISRSFRKIFRERLGLE